MDDTDFDRFWNAYPPRKGDKAKQPARALFDKAVKSGVSADLMIDSARRYAISEKESANTPFIMQAQRWLRNKRWVDFEPLVASTPTESPKVFVREDTPQWKAWQKVKKTPCVNFGWWFPSEWPPES